MRPLRIALALGVVVLGTAAWLALGVASGLCGFVVLATDRDRPAPAPRRRPASPDRRWSTNSMRTLIWTPIVCAAATTAITAWFAWHATGVLSDVAAVVAGVECFLTVALVAIAASLTWGRP